MKRCQIVVAVCVWVGVAVPSEAQIANPSAVQFNSLDHAAVIPVWEVNAGQPRITQYQGFLFAAASDVATAVPLPFGTGLLIAKALATVVPATTPQDYRLTFAQLGLTLPACTVAPCPQYTLLLSAVGPGGTSTRGVVSESAPFTATVPPPPPKPTLPPAPPTLLRVS